MVRGHTDQTSRRTDFCFLFLGKETNATSGKALLQPQTQSPPQNSVQPSSTFQQPSLAVVVLFDPSLASPTVVMDLAVDV
jgi:hypothetical protein